MTVRSRRILGAAASAAVLAAVVVAAFVGVSLVGGGDEPPPELPDTTPLLTRGPVPTQDPNLPGGFSFPTQGPTPKGPESVEISGVVIPIPEGWRYMRTTGGDMRPGHMIWTGGSTSEQTDTGPIPLGVRFDDFGLTYINVAPSEEAEAGATLDALWDLARKVGTASPSSLSVQGQDIPLPAGSYYSTIEKPLLPDNPLTFRVRLNHSVVIFDSHGLGYTHIASGDEARFQATLDALDTVTAAK